ncbi:MAG TPA: sigma factor [Myxococcaceae bacterium]|nr:sigma factor [Myxococcaceae bacterium]
MSVPARHELVAVMAENRRAFLSFLERRVGHRETAEDLLQESFARSLDRVPLEAEESVTAWFYRVLRNGVIDHYRRAGASGRALATIQRELEE